MAAPTKNGKIPDQRRRRGFERASTLVKGQLKAPPRSAASPRRGC
jgi:hypothetical protein